MIFRKKQLIRRYNEQKFVNGYAVQDSTDEYADIDVQPESNEGKGSEAGTTGAYRVSVFSTVPFTPGNQAAGKKGDRIFWHGRWFECISSVSWDGTPLSHYKSSFVEVREVDNESI